MHTLEVGTRLEIQGAMRILVASVAVLLACNHDSRTVTDGAPGGSDGAPGGGTGVTCGGFANLKCPDGEYCDFPLNNCGLTDQTGSCKTMPAVCPLIVGAPVCACDGKVHTSTCAAAMAGFDLNASGNCPVASGFFACGYAQCDLATQYCVHEHNAGAADSYACVHLPAGCSTVSCTCLAGEHCGNACTGNASAGLTLTCP
jgi:hypothetical protein